MHFLNLLVFFTQHWLILVKQIYVYHKVFLSQILKNLIFNVGVKHPILAEPLLQKLTKI